MIKETISKEEINTLPIETFNGKIEIIDTNEKVKPAIDVLRKSKVLGFDTETRPSFAKGKSYKVALLQLSSKDTCYLFRLNKIGFPIELENLLNNPKIKKIGLSIHDDFSALNKRKLINPINFIDIQDIVKLYGIKDLSLQKIYAILFRKKISKTQRLSNWEADILNEKQQIYAATDAWTTRNIYLKLKKLSPIQSVEKTELSSIITFD